MHQVTDIFPNGVPRLSLWHIGCFSAGQNPLDPTPNENTLRHLMSLVRAVYAGTLWVEWSQGDSPDLIHGFFPDAVNGRSRTDWKKLENIYVRREDWINYAVQFPPGEDAQERAQAILSATTATSFNIAWAWVTLRSVERGEAIENGEVSYRAIADAKEWIESLGLPTMTISGTPSQRRAGIPVTGLDQQALLLFQVAAVKAAAVEQGLSWPSIDSMPASMPVPHTTPTETSNGADAERNEPSTGRNLGRVTIHYPAWQDVARQIASELDAIDAKCEAHDSLRGIADRVAHKMRSMGSKGEGPRGPLSAGTILREALQGGKWKREPRSPK